TLPARPHRCAADRSPYAAPSRTSSGGGCRARCRTLQSCRGQCGWAVRLCSWSISSRIFKLPAILIRHPPCYGLARSHLLLPFAAVDEEEAGHADGEAVGDLFENERTAAVGGLAVNLDAVVDGAGGHAEGV